jgi:hypothetical protein
LLSLAATVLAAAWAGCVVGFCGCAARATDASGAAIVPSQLNMTIGTMNHRIITLLILAGH